MDERLNAVEDARNFLRARTNAVAVARAALYERVADAWRNGISPGDIAKAAGWSTKKAVYDAVAAHDKSTKTDDEQTEATDA